MWEFPDLVEPTDRAPDLQAPEAADAPESADVSEADQKEQERRRAMRFPSDVQESSITIWLSSEQKIAGILVNESRSGISVVVTDDSRLRDDQEVYVNYYGAPMPAVIRHLQRDDDGTCRVGIEWKEFTRK